MLKGILNKQNLASVYQRWNQTGESPRLYRLLFSSNQHIHVNGKFHVYLNNLSYTQGIYIFTSCLYLIFMSCAHTLTVADMFVVCAAVSCRQTVVGAVTVTLLQPLLSTAKPRALPLLTCAQQPCSAQRDDWWRITMKHPDTAFLTREGAGVVEVEAAAVGFLTVRVTSAARDVTVVRLVATIPAGRVRDDWTWRATVCRVYRVWNIINS